MLLIDGTLVVQQVVVIAIFEVTVVDEGIGVPLCTLFSKTLACPILFPQLCQSPISSSSWHRQQPQPQLCGSAASLLQAASIRVSSLFVSGIKSGPIVRLDSSLLSAGVPGQATSQRSKLTSKSTSGGSYKPLPVTLYCLLA